MGLSGSWTQIGAATYRGGGDSGEGDSAAGPRPARAFKEAWPTLVIEAGDSESHRRLRKDMRWWFNASNHDVKIVLLAKLHQNRGSIVLEKWEKRPITTRQGAATTRAIAAHIAAGDLEPTLQHTMQIIRNQATNPVSYDVTRGTLILHFRPLFLRAPGPGEQDIVFSIADLQTFAEAVLEVV